MFKNDTVKTLRQTAKAFGVKGYGRMRKAELVRACVAAMVRPQYAGLPAAKLAEPVENVPVVEVVESGYSLVG